MNCHAGLFAVVLPRQENMAVDRVRTNYYTEYKSSFEKNRNFQVLEKRGHLSIVGIKEWKKWQEM